MSGLINPGARFALFECLHVVGLAGSAHASRGFRFTPQWRRPPGPPAATLTQHHTLSTLNFTENDAFLRHIGQFEVVDSTPAVSYFRHQRNASHVPLRLWRLFFFLILSFFSPPRAKVGVLIVWSLCSREGRARSQRRLCCLSLSLSPETLNLNDGWGWFQRGVTASQTFHFTRTRNLGTCLCFCADSTRWTIIPTRHQTFLYLIFSFSCLYIPPETQHFHVVSAPRCDPELLMIQYILYIDEHVE